MKNVGLTYHSVGHKADPFSRVPRGLVVVGAALMSWLILVGAGSAAVQIFGMIASHL